MVKCELEAFAESPSKWGKERMEPGLLEDLILAMSFTSKSGLYEVPTSREFLVPFLSVRQMLLGHNRTSLPCSLARQGQMETEIFLSFGC